MSEGFIGVFLILGSCLVLIGAIGAARMPDLMLRMHATTKAGSLGGGFIAIAAGIYFDSPEVTVRAIAIFIFLLLTAPIAAHAIGRAAYFVGVPFWDKTLKDELRDKLDIEKQILHSGLEEK